MIHNAGIRLYGRKYGMNVPEILPPQQVYMQNDQGTKKIDGKINEKGGGSSPSFSEIDGKKNYPVIF